MKRPSIRFTIRTLLVATTAMAMAVAFSVASYRTWRIERAAITRLNDLSYWHVSEISQDLLDQIPDDDRWHCGSVPPGVGITHDSVLPNFVSSMERHFGVNFFHRVTHMSIHRAHDPRIVSELSNFGRLQSVAFSYSPSAPDARESEESEFLGAIRLYASLNPHLDVKWPDDPPPNATRELTDADNGPFGSADPFSGSAMSDPFGADPFANTPGSDPVGVDPFADQNTTEP